MAEIRIHGIEELQKKLGKAAANQVLREPMHRSVKRIQSEMQRYPTQRPNSLYVRTGTLGRRWTSKVKMRADGVEGVVGNNTEYAQWVQSARYQAQIHEGRWTNTDEKTIERFRPTILDDFKRAIDKALEGR